QKPSLPADHNTQEKNHQELFQAVLRNLNKQEQRNTRTNTQGSSKPEGQPIGNNPPSAPTSRESNTKKPIKTGTILHSRRDSPMASHRQLLHHQTATPLKKSNKAGQLSSKQNGTTIPGLDRIQDHKALQMRYPATRQSRFLCKPKTKSKPPHLYATEANRNKHKQTEAKHNPRPESTQQPHNHLDSPTIHPPSPLKQDQNATCERPDFGAST
ncbi:hypothetical protein Ancab_025197, partial [Ancistrocladus abbreviatus]